MKIVTTETVLDVNTKQLKICLEIVEDFGRVEDYRFSDRITTLVAERVAAEVLDKRMNEIISKIDIDTIIKKVQMNIIQAIGRQS